MTQEEHQKLKAIASLKGQSIKEFVLQQTLGDTPDLKDMSESEALRALSEFLSPRLDQARQREFSTKSYEEIREDARRRAGL